jgi:hypothetical protein
MAKTKRSGAQKRKRIERTHDQKRIASLYLQGRTITEIAEALLLSRNTVWRDLQALEEEWTRDGILDMHRAKMRQLLGIRNLRDEAIDAWNKSKEGETETTHTGDPDAKTKARKLKGRLTVKKKSSNGDPAYLNAALKTFDMESELLGTKIRKLELDPGDTPTGGGGVIIIPA